MSTLQVKNVPAALHARLKQRAAEERCTLSDFILRSVERELSRGEWTDRFRQRTSVDLGVRAAQLVDEERRLRNEQTA